MLSLKLETGEAFALASDNPAHIEGAHAKHLLYVFDEAKTVAAATWDAAEGAFSSGDCRFLAISTPSVPVGRFYDIHARKPGLDDWWTRHITLEEAVEAGRVDREWAEQRARQWGEDSAVYLQRVLGEFAQDEEDAIITLALVEAAVERWRAWDDAGRPDLGGRRVLGVDVAAGGKSKSCIAERVGDAIVSLEKWGKTDPMETAGRVAKRLGDGVANVDVIGVGSGTVARLRELGSKVVGINFGSATRAKDKSGELKMLNVRAEAWWGMKERLEDGDVMLPPDDDMIGDLVAPRKRMTSSGKLGVESKADVVKRLGHSPDVGDAVTLAFLERGYGGEADIAGAEKESKWTAGHGGRSRWRH